MNHDRRDLAGSDVRGSRDPVAGDGVRCPHDTRDGGIIDGTREMIGNRLAVDKQAGNNMADKQPDEPIDWIREIVIKRAEAMGLTAYAIAEATGLEVSHDTVKRFLMRRVSVRSDHLSMIFTVMGLDVKGAKK